MYRNGYQMNYSKNQKMMKFIFSNQMIKNNNMKFMIN